MYYKYSCHLIIGLVSTVESSEAYFTFLQILTRDSVTCSVDGVVYYKVFNPAVAVANVENFR